MRKFTKWLPLIYQQEKLHQVSLWRVMKENNWKDILEEFRQNAGINMHFLIRNAFILLFVFCGF